MTRIYQTFNYPGSIAGDKTLLTGIRKDKFSSDVYISGFYVPITPLERTISFVYKGPLDGSGTFHPLNFPSAKGRVVTSTNLYGPNCGDKPGYIQVVGNYFTASTGPAAIGCLYEGPLDGSGEWTTIIPTSNKPVLSTICHSTMGGLIVGNYDTEEHVSKAFIYDIKEKKYHDIIIKSKPKITSITAYGIWHNGDGYYTICGGFSTKDTVEVSVTDTPRIKIDTGYIVDWNNDIERFENFTSFNYDNDPIKSLITHFDGITSDTRGGYNLTGDYIEIGDKPQLGFFANVKRCCDYDDGFRKATWSPVKFPGSIVSSGNSVYRDVVIGVYVLPQDETVYGYVSQVVGKHHT
jgi:hypothetical protein